MSEGQTTEEPKSVPPPADKIPEPTKTPKQVETKKDFSEEIIDYNSDEPFKGVISRLFELYMGNPYNKGAINITASGSLGNQPYQLIDFTWKSHWVSEDGPNQWVKFDFKQTKVHVTGYLLKTYDYVPGGNHLKSWVLEGSSNDNDWIEIDRHQNCYELNDRSKYAYFQVKTPGTYRYYRITQIGYSHCESEMLALSAVEFYGRMRPDLQL